ncbi:MAG: Electron transport complex subunit RsxB [Firmicutes bacterium]|nr:Electron transport complex subunit RsxB [candidate division NPL-UPA2 bacterium]
MALRKIIKIDEELCNGCGLCVPGCAEGALQIVDGKAKLVKEQYCDGLGACLGECPTGALIVEERESVEYDEVATNEWLKSIGRPTVSSAHSAQEAKHHAPPHQPELPCGCPGTNLKTFGKRQTEQPANVPASAGRSELTQWPIQLMLVPPSAPFLREADLLLAADCVPFAYPDFHRKMLKGRALLIACPKLDNAELYVDKLAQMIRQNDFRSITIAHMEVPCCFGLGRIVNEAVKRSGVKVPVMSINVGVEGELK